MSRRIRIAVTATLSVVLALSSALAQSPQPLTKAVAAARIDSMVQAYMAQKGPASMSVAVSRGNEMLVQKAWGMADVAARRPATAATVYMIGSVSKQFTAVLILKQVERGKLTLTDSIGRYLTTGLRPEWRSLTIEQLLNHTSGLQADLKREGAPEVAVPADTMIAWAARDTMRFAPGTRFAYSNVGYVLLGALVEKLYGKPYGVALRDEIAGPLGLQTLGWCTDPARDAMAATGHTYTGPGKNEPGKRPHPSKSLGAGGLCATAGDLAAWNRALHGGRVVSPASYAAMITPRGASKAYGFGLQMGQRPAPWGAHIIYHLGGIMGFAAENAWLPEESLSVTVLYNSSIGNGFPTNFILELARAVSVQSTPTAPSAAVPPTGKEP